VSVDLLRTIGGIGPLAAMTLLTEIIDIARFKILTGFVVLSD